MESSKLIKVLGLFNMKEFLKGILIVFSYFLMGTILNIPFSFLVNKNIISLAIANIGIYFVLMIFYSIIFIKDLIKDFKDFKKSYKNILKVSFNYWIKGFFIMFVSSLIIGMINISNNSNQEANIELLKSMPMVEVLCACLFAPITEELVFRRGFKNVSRNIHVYAFISGLLFAFVHILSDLDSLVMLTYLIPYGALGIAFGYAYRKTDNIYGTMIMHATHNALSLIQIFLLGCIL